jgi:hypothetical protein
MKPQNVYTKNTRPPIRKNTEADFRGSFVYLGVPVLELSQESRSQPLFSPASPIFSK